MGYHVRGGWHHILGAAKQSKTHKRVNSESKRAQEAERNALERLNNPTHIQGAK